jgi:O-6-methylguanine DNA methyltransferase
MDWMGSMNQTRFWVGCLEQTPIGPLTVLASQNGLARVDFGTIQDIRGGWLAQRGRAEVHNGPAPSFLQEGLTQIDEYLRGERREFDLPLDLSAGSEFDRRIWKLLLSIPFGAVQTYQQVGEAAGYPQAPRAIGGANGRNPLPPIVPCHRLVGRDRRLHGYSHVVGVKVKVWLLELEGHQIVNQKLV